MRPRVKSHDRCCCYHYSRENGSSDCPTCKHALDESRLFPDNYANREIQSLTVKCPNTKLGCTAVVELRNVQVRSIKPCNIIYIYGSARLEITRFQRRI